MNKRTEIPASDVERLWSLYRASPGSLEALETLVRALIPMVIRVLERLRIRLPPQVAMDDLLQAGLLGLCEAIDRYDPSRGAGGLESFALPRVRGAILDELRRQDHVSRRLRGHLKKMEQTLDAWIHQHGRSPSDDELAMALGITTEELWHLAQEGQPLLSLDEMVLTRDGQEISLKDVVGDPTAETPSETTEHRDTLQLLRAAFRLLPEREQKILYLHYYEGLRLSDIAAVFGVSEARICQIHGLAIAKLRAVLRQFGFADRSADSV